MLFAGDRLLANRAAMAASFVVVVLDIVYILPGRSGYVSVLVMGVVIVVLLARGLVAAEARTGRGDPGGPRGAAPIEHVRAGTGSRRLSTKSKRSTTATFAAWHVARRPRRLLAQYRADDCRPSGVRRRHRRLSGRLSPYVEGVEGWRGVATGDPHNQFLKFLGEQGIIGLAAVLFLIFRAVTCPAPVPYRQLAIAVMAGWCATSLANSHFSTFVEGRMLFFCLGAMLADPARLRNNGGPIT